jgi:hypothetical protein
VSWIVWISARRRRWFVIDRDQSSPPPDVSAYLVAVVASTPASGCEKGQVENQDGLAQSPAPTKPLGAYCGFSRDFCRQAVRGWRVNLAPMRRTTGADVQRPLQIATANGASARASGRSPAPPGGQGSALSDLALVLIAEGRAACAPPTRRRPGRSQTVTGQTAVGVMTP